MTSLTSPAVTASTSLGFGQHVESDDGGTGPRRPDDGVDLATSFWALVANCLKPGGQVFFADDAYRTPDELLEGESSRPSGG